MGTSTAATLCTAIWALSESKLCFQHHSSRGTLDGSRDPQTALASGRRLPQEQSGHNAHLLPALAEAWWHLPHAVCRDRPWQNCSPSSDPAEAPFTGHCAGQACSLILVGLSLPQTHILSPCHLLPERLGVGGAGLNSMPQRSMKARAPSPAATLSSCYSAHKGVWRVPWHRH